LERAGISRALTARQHGHRQRPARLSSTPVVAFICATGSGRSTAWASVSIYWIRSQARRASTPPTACRLPADAIARSSRQASTRETYTILVAATVRRLARPPRQRPPAHRYRRARRRSQPASGIACGDGSGSQVQVTGNWRATTVVAWLVLAVDAANRRSLRRRCRLDSLLLMGRPEHSLHSRARHGRATMVPFRLSRRRQRLRQQPPVPLPPRSPLGRRRRQSRQLRLSHPQEAAVEIVTWSGDWTPAEVSADTLGRELGGN